MIDEGPELTISRVLLMSDVMATRGSEQASNLRWLRDLLERPLRTALPNVEFEVDLPADFDRSVVLSGVVSADVLGERHCWFDADRIGAAGLEYLSASVGGSSTLLIGYELSEPTRAALSRAGVPWLDLWLHPVRFADDVMFGIGTSVPEVRNRLDGFAVPQEPLYAQADLLKVQGYRGFSQTDASIINGAALLVGQTPFDKSVLGENGFLSLAHFKAEIQELAARHPHVYFSRHPNAPRLDPVVAETLKLTDNMSEISAPTYSLLGDTRIETVASISSSVLEEARYFGKTTVRFFKSPFPLEGPHAYATIFQDLCFGHFWAEILAGIAPTVAVPPASYIDPKNKLRHALSFYWGYRDIDRYEHVARSAQKPQASLSGPKEVPLDEILVSSFDIFDTLVTRRVARPRDVFDLMAEDAAVLAGVPASEFTERRLAAERAARLEAKKKGRDEPTLQMIYAALVGEDDPTVEALTALEIDTEIGVCSARAAGRRLFDAARASERQVILVSDMYLPASAVERILEACGYEGWDRLYVSSEEGRTKRSGAQYQQILDDIDVPARRILHIGDNAHSDDVVAKREGFSTSHLPQSLDNLERAAPFFREASNVVRNEGLSQGSAILSLISSKYFDRASGPADWSDFGRDPEAFGYVCLGPLIAGFGEWLGQKAQNDDLTMLGFLTREGPIFRAAFEGMNPAHATRTSTVYASRRIARNASFSSVDEVMARVRHLRMGKYENAADLFAVEFGLASEDIDASALEAHRLSSVDAPFGDRVTRKTLADIVSVHAERIVDRSKQVRADLSDYLKDVGLDDGKGAVVDIGYAGTVQATYVGAAQSYIAGLYLATFRTADDNLSKLAHEGYLASGVDPGDRRFGICRHRKIYETLLCSPEPSFIGIKRTAGGWTGVPASETSETPERDSFIRQCHVGAMEFVRDYQAYRHKGTRISPKTASAFLDACLLNPTPQLAAWLGRLEFDDRLDTLTPQTLASRVGGPGRSVWPEGATQLTKRQTPVVRRKAGPEWAATGPYGLLGWRHVLTPGVAYVVSKIGNETDADHYRDDPIGFFRRLSDKRYRRIGRVLYPWD